MILFMFSFSVLLNIIMGLALITQWTWRATVPFGWSDALAYILCSYQCSYMKMNVGPEFRGVDSSLISCVQQWGYREVISLL